MRLPRGRLVRSRVVADPGVALSAALDDALTGYAVLEPADTLLLDDDAKGVVTFEDGVPVLAYHTRTDRGGPAAVADLAVPGPYSVDCYELDRADLAPAHDAVELRVPPGLPADRLAGDHALADRTRERAPADRPDDDSEAGSAGAGAVAAFLDDEAKVEAIRERARAEARERAAEWGLDDHLVDEGGGAPPDRK